MKKYRGPEIFSFEIESGKMIANVLKKAPKEAVKTGMYVALAGFAGMQVFPVLREWEVFSMFPSKAYMEREVCKRLELDYIYYFSP
jgi:hypothetical protein